MHALIIGLGSGLLVAGYAIGSTEVHEVAPAPNTQGHEGSVWPGMIMLTGVLVAAVGLLAWAL